MTTRMFPKLAQGDHRGSVILKCQKTGPFVICHRADCRKHINLTTCRYDDDNSVLCPHCGHWNWPEDTYGTWAGWVKGLESKRNEEQTKEGDAVAPTIQEPTTATKENLPPSPNLTIEYKDQPAPRYINDGFPLLKDWNKIFITVCYEGQGEDCKVATWLHSTKTQTRAGWLEIGGSACRFDINTTNYLHLSINRCDTFSSDRIAFSVEGGPVTISCSIELAPKDKCSWGELTPQSVPNTLDTLESSVHAHVVGFSQEAKDQIREIIQEENNQMKNHIAGTLYPRMGAFMEKEIRASLNQLTDVMAQQHRIAHHTTEQVPASPTETMAFVNNVLVEGLQLYRDVLSPEQILRLYQGQREQYGKEEEEMVPTPPPTDNLFEVSKSTSIAVSSKVLGLFVSPSFWAFVVVLLVAGIVIASEMGWF